MSCHKLHVNDRQKLKPWLITNTKAVISAVLQSLADPNFFQKKTQVNLSRQRRIILIPYIRQEN